MKSFVMAMETDSSRAAADKLLAEWERRSLLASLAHARSANRCANWYVRLGVKAGRKVPHFRRLKSDPPSHGCAGRKQGDVRVVAAAFRGASRRRAERNVAGAA